jgi:hypothetical protein
MAEEKGTIVIPNKDDIVHSENQEAAALQGEYLEAPREQHTGKRKRTPSPARESTLEEPPKKRKYIKKAFEPEFEWEKDYIMYFENMLTRGNAMKAVTLLRNLSCNKFFSIRRNQTLGYKNKNLGNIFLLMHYLFLTTKTEKQMTKRTLELKKALASEDVKI